MKIETGEQLNKRKNRKHKKNTDETKKKKIINLHIQSNNLINFGTRANLVNAKLSILLDFLDNACAIYVTFSTL